MLYVVFFGSLGMMGLGYYVICDLVDSIASLLFCFVFFISLPVTNVRKTGDLTAGFVVLIEYS